MTQPTSNLGPAAETVPDLAPATRLTPTRPLPPGTLLARVRAPGWWRAWRSCWPLALAVAVVSGCCLALLADFQQPRGFERVAVVRIAAPIDDPRLTLAAQLHHLRSLGEQPGAAGLAIVEGSAGEVELRLRGRDPQALERQMRTVVALHRQEMAARQRQAGVQRTAELAHVEAQLKELPLPVAQGDREARQEAKAALERASKSRRELETELGESTKQGVFTAPPLPPGVAEKLLRGDARGLPLIETRDRLLADMNTIRKVAARSNVDKALRPLRLQLTKVEEQIAELQERLVQPLRDQARTRWDAGRKEQIARLTDQVSAARTTEQAARQHLEALQAQPMSVDGKVLEERTRLEERRRQLAADVGNLAQEGVAPGGFEVRAETTREASASTRYSGALLAGLLGGFGFGAIVVTRQRDAGKVRSVRELAETTDLPVLGTLPLVSGAVLPIPGARPDGPLGQEVQRLEEAADRLRGPVLRQLPPGPVRLLVTSPGAGDGRTTVATQLAISLARAGKRVLLVDAALDRTDLAWLFQAHPEPGLAEVLRGELEVGSVLQATSFARLCLLPAGHTDAQARAALVQDWSAHLFEPVLAQVDCIVIDGPALDSVPEASAWVGFCQAVLLAVRADHTALAAAHAACQRLHLLQAPVPGLVLLERPPGQRSP